MASSNDNDRPADKPVRLPPSRRFSIAPWQCTLMLIGIVVGLMIDLAKPR
jgi:hypothetical protein